MIRSVKSLVAGALLIPALSQAEGLSYNYAEAGYSQVDPDGPADSVDLYSLRGSLAVAPNWHLVADANFFDVENADNPKVYRAGVGYNHSLNTTVDLVGRLAWVHADAGDDEDGFNLQALARGQVAPNFELEGGLDYVDYGNDADTTSVLLAGRYFVTPAFALGLNTLLNDDAKSYGVDFRFNFK